LGGLLVGIDSVRLGIWKLDVLCFPNLGDSPDEMTERKDILVSKT
jgi:hypothetical protein